MLGYVFRWRSSPPRPVAPWVCGGLEHNYTPGQRAGVASGKPPSLPILPRVHMEWTTRGERWATRFMSYSKPVSCSSCLYLTLPLYLIWSSIYQFYACLYVHLSPCHLMSVKYIYIFALQYTHHRSVLLYASCFVVNLCLSYFNASFVSVFKFLFTFYSYLFKKNNCIIILSDVCLICRHWLIHLLQV